MDLTLSINRVVSYGLAGIAILALAPLDVLLLFIYMGQAHFVLAYWYKCKTFRNAIRMPMMWLWAVLVLVLFTANFLALMPYNFLIAVTAILFAVHFVIDELELLKEHTGFFRSSILFGGVVVLFVIEILQFAFGIVFASNFLLFAAIATILLTIAGAFRPNTISTSFFRTYVITLAGISGCAIVFSQSIHLAVPLGFIILAHYFIWYLDYYSRVRANPIYSKIYIQRVVLLNVLMFGIWALVHFGVTVPFYEYFFTEVYFYIWTCIHILFSFIPRDIGMKYFVFK